MYGTIGHFRVKAGMEEQLVAIIRQVGNLNLPGTLAAYCYRMDTSPQDYYIAVVSASKESYFANAENSEMQALDRQLMALLESEPEWHDGEIVYALKEGT